MITDILLDDDLDLRIEQGDLVIGESTKQHLRLLLETDKGDWRATPYVGVGIRSLLLDEATPVAVQNEIQRQMEADGVKVKTLEMGRDGKLTVKGHYE